MHLRENGQMGTALRVAVRSRPALAGEYDSPIIALILKLIARNYVKAL